MTYRDDFDEQSDGAGAAHLAEVAIALPPLTTAATPCLELYRTGLEIVPLVNSYTLSSPRPQTARDHRGAPASL